MRFNMFFIRGCNDLGAFLRLWSIRQIIQPQDSIRRPQLPIRDLFLVVLSQLRGHFVKLDCSAEKPLKGSRPAKGAAFLNRLPFRAIARPKEATG